MAENEHGLGQRIAGVFFRHPVLIAIAIVLVASWTYDWRFHNSAHVTYLWTRLMALPASLSGGGLDVFLLLPAVTLLLAFANLYLKISTRAPALQRLLKPGAFANMPFAVYFAVYFLLAAFSYTFFGDKLGSHFAKIVVPALVGIGAANADLKFGGFNLQPFADFLQGLEAVVEAGISSRMNDLAIAKRASLRDELVEQADTPRLERECNLLGVAPQTLQTLHATANGDDVTYRGLLAGEIIKVSEADAWRLVAATSKASTRYRIRWWSS
jgi:hypothetical protein